MGQNTLENYSLSWETKVAELFKDVEWTQNNLIIRKVFLTFAVNSLTKPRIEEVAKVLFQFNNVPDLYESLHALKKKKVLRSYQRDNKIYWEVNFSD